jgi:hypothetical protein
MGPGIRLFNTSHKRRYVYYDWLAASKGVVMKGCCKDFFDANGLQGIENEPMQFCPSCGHKLTQKEFNHYNNKVVTTIKKVYALVDYKGNIEPYNGAIAIFEEEKAAEFNKYFYKTTKPKVTTCFVSYTRK